MKYRSSYIWAKSYLKLKKISIVIAAARTANHIRMKAVKTMEVLILIVFIMAAAMRKTIIHMKTTRLLDPPIKRIHMHMHILTRKNIDNSW